MIAVSRLHEPDWATLRDVRLAALRDSPDAFGSTLARELAFGDEQWRARARASAWFAGLDGDVPVGIACGFRHENEGERHLLAMWVAPAQRGRGLSDLLVDEVMTWARADGGTRLSLWVVQGNGPAEGLYLRHGFRHTGAGQPLPRRPDVVEVEMVIDPL
jgi:GNAT superfamily N-acetyltransferase